MGMDGLSMANTGMLREATSRDFANQTEESIHKDIQNKQVDQLQTQMRVKEDESGNQKDHDKKKKKRDDEASTYENESEQLEQNVVELNNSEGNPIDEDLENRSFYVKITKDGEIFELYDKESNRLVEKIDSEEVNQLINKLNMASGILVNRKI